MNLKPLPQRILDRVVLAAVRVPARPGEWADQCFVVIEARSLYDAPLYSVYHAQHTGKGWEPENGSHDLTWPGALDTLAERVRQHPRRSWPAEPKD